MDEIDLVLARRRIELRLPDPHVRKSIRQRAGVTQLQVAEAVGVTQAAINSYERGLRPGRKVIAHYMAVLDRLDEFEGLAPAGPRSEVRHGGDSR